MKHDRPECMDTEGTPSVVENAPGNGRLKLYPIARQESDVSWLIQALF